MINNLIIFEVQITKVILYDITWYNVVLLVDLYKSVEIIIVIIIIVYCYMYFPPFIKFS